MQCLVDLKDSRCVITLYLRIILHFIQDYLKSLLEMTPLDPLHRRWIFFVLKYIAAPGPVSGLVFSSSNPTHQHIPERL